MRYWGPNTSRTHTFFVYILCWWTRLSLFASFKKTLNINLQKHRFIKNSIPQLFFPELMVWVKNGQVQNRLETNFRIPRHIYIFLENWLFKRSSDMNQDDLETRFFFCALSEIRQSFSCAGKNENIHIPGNRETH